MSKLVIIGQSPAVVAVIKKIRENAEERDITLISADGERPYDRSLFAKLIARKVKDKDLFCEAEEFYTANKVELILDKEITRLNFNRCKIFLADRAHVDYDDLIIADAPQPRLPEKKGIRKVGVFHLARLDAVRRLIKYLPFTETAVVEAVSLVGIETALALKENGKDVIIVTSEDQVMSGILGEDGARLLFKLLEKRGIRVFTGSAIEDILGDVELKAVRLKSGKVLACEMVVFDDVAPDLRFLAESDLVVSERITVKATMQTNLPHVWAIDTVIEMQEPKMKGNYSLAKAIGRLQGEVAAMNVRSEETIFTWEASDGRASLEAIFSLDEIKGVEAENTSAFVPLPAIEAPLEGTGSIAPTDGARSLG